MRRSKLLPYMVAIGLPTLLGCNTGRSIPPLHRPAPTVAPADSIETEDAPKIPTTAPAENKPPKPAAVEAIPEPKTAAAPVKPAITGTVWCQLRESGSGYMLSRYTLTTGAKQALYTEQWAVPKDGRVVPSPEVKAQRWSQIDSEKPGAVGAEWIGVEPLDPATAQASPEFNDQTDLLEKLTDDNVNVESGLVNERELGAAGGLRLVQRNPLTAATETVVFACADYSPTFASPGKLASEPKAAPQPAPSAEAAKPGVPAPATTEAPAKVDPMLKVSVRALTSPFRAIEVKPLWLANTRWCAWAPSPKGTMITIMQFGPHTDPKQHVTISKLPKDTLEKDIVELPKFQDLLDGPLVATKIDKIDESKFTTAAGVAYRQIEDVNEVRTLVVDDAGPNAAPSAAATTFFECIDGRIPADSPVLNRNLRAYMDQREKWNNAVR